MAEPIVLPAEPGIRDIDTLRELLLDRLDDSAPVAIDGAAVSRIDTAALQLLAAFVQDRSAQQRDTNWLAVSSGLAEAAKLIDLDVSLGLAGSHG